ncbi:MAG: kinase/pyrophosphorylase [Alphaproteobacteria bacterium]|nr:kinase/pyrophosphorylase [Alphaproteobacteria bacterium]
MTNTETEKTEKRRFTLHLVSDATGTTLLGIARACLAQFEEVEPVQKFWPLVRTHRQLERVIARIDAQPGPVIYTFVDESMRARLKDHCDELNIPCVEVLEPVIRALSAYLGRAARGVPGLQHTMDDAYFRRVAALDFAIRFDDGKRLEGVAEADVVLVGVSRTSKTPTSVYLARRGIKAANIPLVPGVDIPETFFTAPKPLYVGLTAAPDRLMHIRRSRLKAAPGQKNAVEDNEYLDFERIEEEVKAARRLFAKYGWPVIDVTKRSIEETAAEIMSLLQNRQEGDNGTLPEILPPPEDSHG